MPHRIHVRDSGPGKAAGKLCRLAAAKPVLLQYPLEAVCGKCHEGYIHDTRQDLRHRECRLCHAADHPVTLRHAAGFAPPGFSHAAYHAFACRECHAEMDLMTSDEPGGDRFAGGGNLHEMSLTLRPHYDTLGEWVS